VEVLILVSQWADCSSLVMAVGEQAEEVDAKLLIDACQEFEQKNIDLIRRVKDRSLTDQ